MFGHFGSLPYNLYHILRDHNYSSELSWNDHRGSQTHQGYSSSDPLKKIVLGTILEFFFWTADLAFFPLYFLLSTFLHFSLFCGVWFFCSFSPFYFQRILFQRYAISRVFFCGLLFLAEKGDVKSSQKSCVPLSRRLLLRKSGVCVCEPGRERRKEGGCLYLGKAPFYRGLGFSLFLVRYRKNWPQWSQESSLD